MRLTYRSVISGHRLIAALAAGLCLLPAACGSDGAGTSTSASTAGDGGFDADRAFEDVRAMVELGPRPSGSDANAQQAELLAAELREAGVENVTVGEELRNVTGVIAGEGEGYVVLAAHHDTKDLPGFVGANDGASGAAVVLELARSLPKPLPGPSLAIALFDGEEARGDRAFEADGTRGSEAYVAVARDGGDPAAGIPPLAEIEAMVLLDMVGDCDLQIPREFSSDERIYGAFAEAAGGAPFEGVTGSILDDHVPFLERGIPAVDLIDFTFGGNSSPGEYWHTDEDTLDKVCPESLDAVGEAGLEALQRLP
jgi:glutaminyl-peptide cyclotransferase